MLRLLPARLSTLAFSTILISAISSGAARADDCSNEKALKSPASTVETLLSFQNKSAEKRRIYWIDQDGDRKFYGIVEPGNGYRQPTFAGHAWVITDDAEKCLYTFVASAEPRAVDVGVEPETGADGPSLQVFEPVAVEEHGVRIFTIAGSQHGGLAIIGLLVDQRAHAPRQRVADRSPSCVR